MKRTLSLLYAVLLAAALVSCGGEPATTTAPLTTVAPTTAAPTETAVPTTTELPILTEPPVTTEPPVVYCWGDAVPTGETKDRSYFDDALFVGDSRIGGFMISTGVTNAKYCYAQGYQVNQFTTTANVTAGSSMLTMHDAIAAYGTDYKKVYIAVGLNELGWDAYSYFYNHVCTMIDGIRALNPNVTIYLIAVTPVTAENAQSISWHSLEKIAIFNGKLIEAARDKQVYFIDVDTVFKDEKGYLKEELSAIDGAHFTREGYGLWRDYLLCHTADALQ